MRLIWFNGKNTLLENEMPVENHTNYAVKTTSYAACD
jgi:hypothetical protein